MHCINVILLKLSDVPGNLEVHQLKEDIVATSLENIDILRKNNVEHIIVETDYFGGCGEQSCDHFRNGINTKCNSINNGLFFLGIFPIKNTDAFDRVGLGNFRSNKDFYFRASVDSERHSMTGWFKHLEKLRKINKLCPN